MEYSSYAIMGYTIRQWAISRRGRRGNLWKGILLILVGLGIEAVIAILSPDKVLTDRSWLSVSPLAPLVVVASLAVFAGFAILPVKFSCAKTASWTFMIYLVHMWVLDIVGPERFPEKWTTWNALAAIPAVSVVVFAVSALIAGVYEKIRTLAKAGQLKYAIMNVMKAVEKYLKKYRYLILAFGLTLIFFGIFAKVDYATDTYADIVHSPKVMWAHFLGSGRFVTAVFYALFVKLGLSFKTIYLISFAAAVVALSVAIYVLKKILDKYVKNEILAFVGAAIILINPFTIELFLYAEKGVMVASVLFAVLATRSFVKYLETKKKRNILLAVMWAVLGACSYQGTLGVVVVLMTLVVVLEKKKVSDFIKWTVMSVLIYGGAAVVNLGGAKLLMADGVRMAQDMNLWKTIQAILVKTPGMLGFYKMASVGMIAAVVAIILVAVVVYVVKAKKFKEFGVAVAKIIYLAIVAYLAAVAPQVTQGEEMVWLVARSTYVFGAIIGLAFCVLLAELPKIREEKVISGAFLAAAVVFLATVWMGSMKISIDHYNINALDKERALAIGKIIAEYEEENDVVIKKIGLFPDSAMGYSYKDMMVVGDINISAFATGWSDDPAVNYWNDRRMEEISIDDEAEEYCAARNWDYFEKEQVFFRDDTVFVCKF